MNDFEYPQPLDTTDREALIAEYRQQIDKEGKELYVVLRELYTEGKRFVLIGENHTQIDAMHKGVQASLPQLRQRGLTHLFLEVERDLQSVIDNLDVLADDKDCVSFLKSRGVRGTYTSEENLRTMILAKRLGINIVFIDDPQSIKQTYVEKRIPIHKRFYIKDRGNNELEKQERLEQNERDERMFKTVQKSIDDQSRGLVIIGNRHVRKSKGEPTFDRREWVWRLGSRLFEQYGDKVSSIRYVFSDSTIDQRFGSNKPAPSDIYPALQEMFTKPTGTIVLKDEGLFAGDELVTDSDFVLIPTMQ